MTQIYSGDWNSRASKLDKTPLTTGAQTLSHKSSERKLVFHDLPQLFPDSKATIVFEFLFHNNSNNKNGHLHLVSFLLREHLLILLYSPRFKKFSRILRIFCGSTSRVHFHGRGTYFPDVRLPIPRWIVSGGNRYERGPLRSGSALCKPHPVQEESAFTVAVARSR